MVVLIGASYSVAAEAATDPTGDVWHHPNNGIVGSWSGTVDNKPNIDITNITGTVNGGNLTINLTVAGSIENSTYVIYGANCNTSYVFCHIDWYNGVGSSSQAIPREHTVMNNGIFHVSGNTISVVFPILDTPTAPVVDVWGTATEYTHTGPGTTTYEYWEDWAPNSKIPFNTTTIGNTGNTTSGTSGNTNGGNTGTTTGGNNAGKKTPGFEIFPVLVAVAIAALVVRRRR